MNDNLKPTRVFVVDINPEITAWAQQQYPQYWREDLGEKKRTSFLLSRALLHHVLYHYYDNTLSALPELAYTEHQKPYFKHYPITFNLTHSADFIGLVIAEGDLPIGIDIETIQRRRNFEGLLKRTFHESEISWVLKTIDKVYPLNISSEIMDHLPQKAMERFFLLWSAKEAYLKADGRGIQGLHSVLFSPERATMTGDLANGTLLATVLPSQHSDQLSSFAVYIPTTNEKLQTIKYLLIRDQEVCFQNHHATWQVIMQDTSH